MGFLEKIATRYLEDYGNDLHKVAFVFPTRRAGLYFRRHLQKQAADRSLWAPPVYSIGDFFPALSGFTVPEPLDLVFELFGLYRRHAGSYPKDFDEFYPWGKMIISDFDEIDKHLVNPGKLFDTLKEFKKIEDRYAEDMSGIRKRYTGFWLDLGVIYREFTGSLKKDGRATEGMAYRWVAENIAKIIERDDLGWERAAFCGFNALTRSEETVIRHLLEEDRADIFWDMDRYFTDDVNQEAGYFFRKNRETLVRGEPDWLDERLSEPREIRVIGVQSKVSQAKILGLQLKEMFQAPDLPGRDPGKIAVVLPDETLLFPVLNSLPGEVERINITLGYPLQQTPAYSLAGVLMDIQVRLAESRGRESGFYYKDVQNYLNHPYIKPLAPGPISDLMKDLKEANRVYLSLEDEKFKELPSLITGALKEAVDSRAFVAGFLELLDGLRRFYQENEPDLFAIDYEYLYQFYTLLTRFQGSLDKHGMILNIPTFRQLFVDITRAARIPFTGEPLEGLQVMGVLETQALDFDNLFLLSVNEGDLPPGKSHQSFIPFDARCELGMPTYRERDAIFAYHFYRLLKSSNRVTLLYTSESSGLDKSEKSRYIDQLLIEFAARNPAAEISHQVIDFSFSSQPVKEIAVEKSPVALRMLGQRTYSASSVHTYLACPLKFYLSYVLKIREEDEIFEHPDQRRIGNIIHETLEDLYKDFLDRPLATADIEALKLKVEPKLREVFRKELQGKGEGGGGSLVDLDTGRNRIALEVMSRFLSHFFDKEKQDPGFTILKLEEEIRDVPLTFPVDGREETVKLNGHIDRLDVTGEDVLRIIDYKTGKVNPLNLKSMEDLSGGGAADRREAFQLFFYRYLLKHSYKDGGKPFRLGIYPFKKIYEELKFVRVDKKDIIDDGMLDAFEGVLKQIFSEIFDPTVPFRQTRDDNNCRYCPYVNICSRDPAEQFH